MHKIAVMGDYESIFGYSALGLEIFPVDDAENAAKQLKKLSEDYGIIYITEALAAKIPQQIEKYRFSPLPAIILIPGTRDNTGEGMRAIHKSVEKAVGSDIL